VRCKWIGRFEALRQFRPRFSDPLCRNTEVTQRRECENLNERKEVDASVAPYTPAALVDDAPTVLVIAVGKNPRIA
jgi:hypothetical protein